MAGTGAKSRERDKLSLLLCSILVFMVFVMFVPETESKIKPPSAKGPFNWDRPKTRFFLLENKVILKNAFCALHKF